MPFLRIFFLSSGSFALESLFLSSTFVCVCSCSVAVAVAAPKLCVCAFVCVWALTEQSAAQTAAAQLAAQNARRSLFVASRKEEPENNLLLLLLPNTHQPPPRSPISQPARSYNYNSSEKKQNKKNIKQNVQQCKGDIELKQTQGKTRRESRTAENI